MTYQEGMAGLQLVAEEDYGTHLRAQRDAENKREDRSLDNLRRAQLEHI